MKKRADILVYRQGLSKSREMAKRYIMAGQIYTNDQKVSKPGDFFSADTVFELRGEEAKYVSRGGLKLEEAIKKFDIDLTGKVAADFGASTGGFTDCMLQNNAKKVYSIDVGYNQLDYKLRSDSRVIVMERENIRYLDLDRIKDPVDFISIDVSFISLELILPKAFELIEPNGKIVALIKPQFEAGRSQVGKGGIVSDKSVHFEVINKIQNFSNTHGFYMNNITKSPITGAKGNIEYLTILSREENIISKNYINSLIER